MSKDPREYKHLTDKSSNEMIREAIRAIALKNVVHRQSGIIRGTEKITGYVAKLHLDEDDELYGTVDVQEYSNYALEDTDDSLIGYHEGVFLTALQDGTQGYVIIPKLYSDVLVAQDPDSGHEYITMVSHVDIIQLDSHEKISIGVREREEYKVDDEDAPDINELELTGVQSNTTYAKDSVVTSVQGESDSDVVTHTIDTTQVAIVVGEDKTSSTMTQDKMNITHNNATLDLTDDEATLAQGSSKVKVTNGVVYVGSDSSNDNAVLGKELASVLEEMLDALAQVQTTTSLGPQPFINLSQFISLKAKIAAFKGAESGFLTPSVKIQK